MHGEVWIGGRKVSYMHNHSFTAAP